MLEALLAPKSIAIIGASDNTNKIGGRPLLYLRRFGYSGEVLPINPNRDQVQGYRAYASINDLPQPPHCAVIAVPGDSALSAVEECAARGVGAAIIMTSGFGEVDEQGRAQQQHMVRVARAAGMRLIGPNSQGLANFGSGAVTSFSTMFLEAEPALGPVAVVSQSGAMSVVPYGMLRQAGIGVRHVHATGNECDVTVGELACAVLEDQAVRLLLLYMEEIPDPQWLARAAATARERDIPIVALKSGRTVSGQRAAASHTGALASEDRIVDAYFKHHGIWRAADMHGLVNATALYLKGWRPSGRRLVAISNSGATCVMAADQAEGLSLPMAELAPATRQRLGECLPGFATTSNPIDITAALLTNNRLFGDILPVVGADAGADLFFIGIPVGGQGYDLSGFARQTAEFSASMTKPVVVAAPQPMVASHFANAGIPTFSRDGYALAALAQLADHVAAMRRPRRHQVTMDLPALPNGQAVTLSEAESAMWLRQAGFPLVPFELVRSADQACAAFQRLGGHAVAVKACSRDVPHKSEHGLVELDVRDESSLVLAFNRQWDKLEQMGAAREGVIIATMRRARRELVLGARRVERFGVAVMLGDGGKYVEALRDFTLLLAPFSRDDLLHALDSLRIAPVLKGVRGEPPLDLDAYADLAVRLGDVMLAAGSQLASIDLNPVMLGAQGEGAWIADALLELAATP